MLIGAVPALANEGPDQRASDDANSAANNVGQSLSDNFITAKIKAKYATDSIVKNSDVDVKTTDHVVELTGGVSSKAERDRAVELAKGTDGVMRVSDKLKVVTPAAMPR
jgi:hyperosmotically inducible protein